MACVNFCIRNCSFRTLFLQNFKNIMRLKGFIVRPHFRAAGTHYYFSNTEKLFKYIFVPSNFSNMNYLNIRFMSRCIRCTHNSSILLNHSSRKKQKSRSLQFAEKVRVKIQSAKRETRRKVHKKIHEIKENILTIPNGLCVLRIISTPILAYLVLSEFYTTSLSLFVFAGFTDLIDGYIARNFPNQQTMIGSFLDPAADKLLIATLFITLTANGLIPVPLTSLIIIRDACLMGAGFYIRYVSLPPPKTLSRYFNMSFVTARLSPTGISKVNTLVQLCLVAASLAAPVFSYVDHTCLHILWYVTAATTTLSAASYLYHKNSTYKLFTDKDDNKK